MKTYKVKFRDNTYQSIRAERMRRDGDIITFYINAAYPSAVVRDFIYVKEK